MLPRYLARPPEVVGVLVKKKSLFYASIAEDKVEVHNLEKSLAMNVSPVVPPGT